MLLSDFGKYNAIFIIECNWPSIVSVLLITGVQSTWVPNSFTARPGGGSDQHSEAYKHTTHQQLSHRTEKELLAAPQQPSWASSWWRWARPEQAAHTRPAHDQLKNTNVLAHSTTNTLDHHPIKPWSRTWSSRSIPGGEGQATSSKPRRRRASRHSGGEGQVPEAEPGGGGQARSKPQLTSLHQDFICKSSATGGKSCTTPHY
jgi:hypothetical protein